MSTAAARNNKYICSVHFIYRSRNGICENSLTKTWFAHESFVALLFECSSTWKVLFQYSDTYGKNDVVNPQTKIITLIAKARTQDAKTRTNEAEG